MNNRHITTITMLLICLVFVLPSRLIAQNPGQEAKQQKQLIVETMVSTYSSLTDPGNTFVEIYMTLLTAQFNYTLREDSLFYAFLQFDVEILNSDDITIDSQSWKRVLSTENETQIGEQAILDQANFLLKPGNYNMKISVIDLSTKEVSVSQPEILSVPRYYSNLLSISDIEFATIIRKAKEDDNFVKHNLYVEPFPARLYSNARPQMYFYAEIYNLGKPENDDDKYTVTYQILNSSGMEVHSSSNKFKKPNTVLALVADKVNILSLSHDLYTLLITVKDEKTEVPTTKQGQFFVYKPQDIVVDNRPSELNMDITQNNIKEYRNQLEYLLTPSQIKTYNNLNFDEKKKFILSYWENQDAAFRKEHLLRHNTANEIYGAFRIEGWRSDRGRVHIMYGPPTNLEPHPADPEIRPWELWNYEELRGQGRVEFIFGDITGFGNYELLHSNIRTDGQIEIYDPDWIMRLRK